MKIIFQEFDKKRFKQWIIFSIYLSNQYITYRPRAYSHANPNKPFGRVVEVHQSLVGDVHRAQREAGQAGGVGVGLVAAQIGGAEVGVAWPKRDEHIKKIFGYNIY